MEWVAYGVTVYSNTPTHQQERVPTESEILERGSGSSVTVAVHPGFFGPRESANQKDLPPGYPATLSKKPPLWEDKEPQVPSPFPSSDLAFLFLELAASGYISASKNGPYNI